MDYDYKWPDENRMDRKDFAHSHDFTHYRADSVYDYQDYYENNLNQHEHTYYRYDDFTYPISVGKEESPPTREAAAAAFKLE